jgi:peptide/nickel transport system ATP-binding protein
MSPGGALLTVKGLTTTLAGSGMHILDNISFSLKAGEVLGVVGESGSGKSMLALTVMGILPRALRRSAGQILLEGEDLARLRPKAWRAKRGRELAMIFQEPLTALNPIMKVGAQVQEVLTRRRGLSAEEARRETLRLFQRVEIPSADQRLEFYPHELSGGMRQRVVIAMALAAQPKLLIADEPTSALDVSVQARVLELLRRLQADLGFACLFISHDLAVVDTLSDRLIVMRHGKIVEQGATGQLLRAPQEAYTQRLIAAVPVPDPIEQKARRAARAALLGREAS